MVLNWHERVGEGGDDLKYRKHILMQNNQPRPIPTPTKDGELTAEPRDTTPCDTTKSDPGKSKIGSGPDLDDKSGASGSSSENPGLRRDKSKLRPGEDVVRAMVDPEYSCALVSGRGNHGDSEVRKLRREVGEVKRQLTNFKSEQEKINQQLFSFVRQVEGYLLRSMAPRHGVVPLSIREVMGEACSHVASMRDRNSIPLEKKQGKDMFGVTKQLCDVYLEYLSGGSVEGYNVLSTEGDVIDFKTRMATSKKWIEDAQDMLSRGQLKMPTITTNLLTNLLPTLVRILIYHCGLTLGKDSAAHNSEQGSFCGTASYSGPQPGGAYSWLGR